MYDILINSVSFYNSQAGNNCYIPNMRAVRAIKLTIACSFRALSQFLTIEHYQSHNSFENERGRETLLLQARIKREMLMNVAQCSRRLQESFVYKRETSFPHQEPPHSRLNLSECWSLSRICNSNESECDVNALSVNAQWMETGWVQMHAYLDLMRILT